MLMESSQGLDQLVNGHCFLLLLLVVVCWLSLLLLVCV